MDGHDEGTLGVVYAKGLESPEEGVMTHWVRVTVMVPVRTDHPSPVKAEDDALKRVQERLAGTDMKAHGADWSRRES